MLIDERRNKTLFRHITNRNLLWQYDYLIDSIRIGVARKTKLDAYTIGALNFFAVINLSGTPGQLRTDDVHIDGAEHEPPMGPEVRKHYLDFIPELHRIWDEWDAFHVAALVLWKINWIHPFEEGNGRTARAAMYYALSVKIGRVLEGKNTIPAQIRAEPDAYYRLLRETDRSFREGTVKLDPLAAFLDRLLRKQLAS